MIYVWQICRENLLFYNVILDIIITIFLHCSKQRDEGWKYWFTCSLDMLKQTCIPVARLSASNFI